MTDKQAAELGVDSRTYDPKVHDPRNDARNKEMMRDTSSTHSKIQLIDEIMELAYLYGKFSTEGEQKFREELTKYLKGL